MSTGSDPSIPVDKIGRVDAAMGSAARSLRESSHATMEEVAAALDIPENEYRQFEQGQHRLIASKLVLLARLHGVTVEHLLVTASDSSDLKTVDATSDEARLLLMFECLDLPKRRLCLEFMEKLVSG